MHVCVCMCTDRKTKFLGSTFDSFVNKSKAKSITHYSAERNGEEERMWRTGRNRYKIRKKNDMENVVMVGGGVSGISNE